MMKKLKAYIAKGKIKRAMKKDKLPKNYRKLVKIIKKAKIG